MFVGFLAQCFLHQLSFGKEVLFKLEDSAPSHPGDSEKGLVLTSRRLIDGSWLAAHWAGNTSPLIVSVTWEGRCYHRHFEVESTEAQRLSPIFQVTGLGSYKAFLESWPFIWNKTKQNNTFLSPLTLYWVGSSLVEERRGITLSAASWHEAEAKIHSVFLSLQGGGGVSIWKFLLALLASRGG